MHFLILILQPHVLSMGLSVCLPNTATCPKVFKQMHVSMILQLNLHVPLFLKFQDPSRSFFDIDESAVHSPNALTDYIFRVHRSKFTFLQLIKMLLRHLLIIMYTFIPVYHLRVA